MSNNILKFLPQNIGNIIEKTFDWLPEEILEIRLRVNQPLQLITTTKDFFISITGKKTNPVKAYKIKRSDLKNAIMLITNYSIYAVERQLIEGFITLPGGHRVGFTGQAVMNNGRIKTIKNINSLNYRLTREKIGVANKVIKKIYHNERDYIYSTLIISPPLCGKTTLLRDLIRIISDGSPDIGLRGKKVGVIDERSEIGGSYNGVPQNKIGYRTDLLDNCPKAKGIILLIRSMSPEVIAVDEIGREEDVLAIKEAVNTGVSVIATVHAENLDAARKRPSIRPLISYNAFQRYIILSKRNGIGTVEKVLDYKGREVI